MGENTPHQPVLYTIKQACKMLGVSRSKLHELATRGQIRVVRLGTRSTRIPRSEIERIESGGL